MSQKIKSHFSYASVVVQANVPCERDFGGEFFNVYTVVGTVLFRFNGNGDWLPAYAGMELRYHRGEQYKKISFQSVAGGTITFYHGLGELGTGTSASSGGSAQLIIGVVDDPNGVHTPTAPASPAVYYKEQAIPPIAWLWNVSAQNWFVALS